MAQFVRHMRSILCADWHVVKITDSFPNSRAAEMSDWLKDPQNEGRYTYWSATADQRIIAYAFDTPETAFAFKLRWV